MKLTEKEIRSLKPTLKKFYAWESIAGRNSGSFGVCVYPSGEKSYVIRVNVNKVRKRLTIGSTKTLSLADARQLGYQLAHDKAGMGETLENSAQNTAETFTQGTAEDLFVHYVNHMQQNGRRTSREVAEAIERDVYCHIPRDIPANQVTSRQVALILADMIARGAPAGSNRLRSYLHAAFNVAMRHDNDPANLNKTMHFDIQFNPVTPVPPQNVEKVGERVLSETELSQLLADVQGQGFSPLTRYALLLCLYSGGQRPYEVLNTKYLWVDFKSKSWTIPSHIAKNNRELVIPLSPQLERLIRESRMFTAPSDFLVCKRLDKTKPMTTCSVAQVLSRYCKREGIEKFVPRDLRRTCKTLMTKHKIGTTETRNRLHNHALNDVSNKHYNKYDYFDEKLEIVSAWGDFLDGLQK